MSQQKTFLQKHYNYKAVPGTGSGTGIIETFTVMGKKIFGLLELLLSSR
jgi:hypothetical protein